MTHLAPTDPDAFELELSSMGHLTSIFSQESALAWASRRLTSCIVDSDLMRPSKLKTPTVELGTGVGKPVRPYHFHAISQRLFINVHLFLLCFAKEGHRSSIQLGRKFISVRMQLASPRRVGITRTRNGAKGSSGRLEVMLMPSFRPDSGLA